MSAAAVPRSPGPGVFLRLRLRLFFNHLMALFFKARLRLVMIFSLSAAIWVALYFLFYDGAQFVRGLDTQVFQVTDQNRREGIFSLAEILYGTFFISLSGLIIFSSGLLLYASLFRSAETQFLLSTPATPARIFAHKFHEAIFFSGWAFVLLGSPLVVAYGVEANAGFLYFLLLIPFLVGFLLLPATIGAAACLIIVAIVPGRQMFALVVLLALVVAGIGLGVSYAIETTPADQSLTIAGVRQILSHLAFTQHPALLSRWMTHGIIQAAKGEWLDSLLDLGLVWGSGGGVYLMCLWLARRLYRRAFNAIHSSTGTRRKFATHWSDRLISALLFWTSAHTRTFVLKDLRTFRRDPLQWTQMLILGGFLLLYFLSIPYLPHRRYEEYARTRIGLLNVAVVGLMLATFTSRFVFPLMSLEGRNFWILGLLPINRARLLIGKFVFAATLTVAASGTLALLSSLMLGLSWWSVAVLVFAMTILALGLSALSVGLGTCLVNLSDSNPSRVATGYGGTINLLLSLVFAVGIVMLAAIAVFAPYEVPRLIAQMGIERASEPAVFAVLLTSSLGVMAIIGLLGVWLPLRMGIRAFRRMEF